MPNQAKIDEPAKHVVCDAGSNQSDRERVVMAKNHLSAERLREILVVLRELSGQGVQKSEVARELGLKAPNMNWILKRHSIVWTHPEKRVSVRGPRYSAEERLARSRYKTQWNSANSRGVAWEITFEQWWEVWQASGHWAQRGRHKGGYVMSRAGDTGPYSPENVRITTNRENFIEAKSHASKRDGVYFVLPGTPKPWWARWKNKHLGYFATEQEAREVRAAAKVADPSTRPAWPPNKGRALTDEHKRKVGLAQIGRQFTAATRAKISEAVKASYARRRAAQM